MVKVDNQVKTLAANVAVEAALKKKENPYLAHRTSSAPAANGAAAVGVTAGGDLTNKGTVEVWASYSILHFIHRCIHFFAGVG